MHYKTNRLNHDFQIVYFIAGACRTPDAAYAILCDQRENREDALKMLRASELRTRAKIVRATRLLNAADEAVRLEAQADIAEIEASSATEQRCIDAAVDELATINRCIEAVKPLRKFAHLTDAQAHEAAQREEWKLQLMHTAQNHMITQGTIPPDHFNTMRMHPEFASEMVPFIQNVRQACLTAKGDLTKIPLAPQGFDLPALLT
jgi:hypothetical protein